MDKERKNGLIDIFVSFLWTVLVIFLIISGFFLARSVYYDTTTFLEWVVGLFGLAIYVTGFLIIWYFIFDSINRRKSNED